MSSYLFLTQLYPSGLSGTSVKTRHTIEYLLRKGHAIDVICIHHVSLVIPNDFIHPRLRIFVVPAKVMSSFSWIYIAKNIPLLFSLTPFRVRKMFSRQLLETTATLLQSNQYAHIFIDGFSMLQYAPLLVGYWQDGTLSSIRPTRNQLRRQFIYIDDEDITDLMRQRTLKTANLVLKLFFYSEYLKCKWYERLVLPFMSRIWAISSRTALHFKMIANCPVKVMPTVVPKRSKACSLTSQNIVFTGLLSWLENTIGIEWFLRSVWPRVLRSVPKAKLLVVGQMAKPSFVDFLQSTPNVVYRGYVPDLAKVYAQSAVAIAPILTNCGIKVKTVTYLSYGLPVVSTTTATWGLASLDGVKTADTATAFADHLITILLDKKLRRRLSQAAFRNAQRNHAQRNLQDFFRTAGLRT